MSARVFLAGEGQTELGGWFADAAYRKPEKQGLLEKLARKVAAGDWQIGEAIVWKKIHKLQTFRAGMVDRETKHVLAAALRAKESGCDVLLFSRDDDGDGRSSGIDEGINQAAAFGIRVAGGVAVQTIEGWLLALSGETGSEVYRPERAKDEWAQKSLAIEQVVGDSSPERLPEDAASLRIWLGRVRNVLASK